MVVVSNSNTETADQFVAFHSDRAVRQLATALLCLDDRSEASEFPPCHYVLFSDLCFIPIVLYLNYIKIDLSALTTSCLRIRASSGYDALTSYEWFPDFSKKKSVPSSLRVKRSGPDVF